MEQQQSFFDEELIIFATWFSENYENLTSEILYASQNKNYVLEYHDDIVNENTGERQTTPARVRDGKYPVLIQLSKKTITENKDYNNHIFVFYMIIWCAAAFHCEGEDIVADNLVIQYCLENNMPKKEFTDGFLFMISSHPNDSNMERGKNISEKFITNNDQA